MEVENGTSKVSNSEKLEGERDANGNQAVLLENRYKANLLVIILPICPNGTLMLRRFLYCRKDLILFQNATIATTYIKLKLKWNSRPLVECYV